MDNQFKFKVNLGGMIDILSNHLYSSPDVFVRELLQNNVDAISARLSKDTNFSKEDGKIEIEVVSQKEIIFRDNGTGLNEDEIHRFLSVIGQSSKYDIKNGHANGDFIGRFGIGLLSCFMVTDSICVRTCSYTSPDTVLEWNGMADGTYTIEKLDCTMPVGTEIIIRNNKQEKESELIDEYFDADTIANLVYYFGLFLKYPIYIINGKKQIRLNLSLSLDAKRDKEKCLQAGKLLLGEEFLDCFPLESSNDLFHGVAYVVPYPVSAHAHSMHRIYLKDMLLTENGDRLMPEWSFFIRCIINTTNLKPTSSREDFYEDDNLELARKEIAECVSEYFEDLDNNNKELLYQITRIHNLAIKSVIASDNELGDMLLPYIIFETSMGELTGKEIADFGGTAFYTCDTNQFKQLMPLYSQRSQLFINAGYVYENAIILRIAEYSTATNLERLTDSDIDFMLDDSEFDGDEDAEEVCTYAERVLRKYDCRVSMKAFQPFEIPTLYTIDEKAAEARMIKRSKESANEVFKDMLSAFENEIKTKPLACLYLNTNNLIIRKILSMTDRKKLRCYIEILYVQALLSGHFPLLHDEMKVLNENLYNLMAF